MTTQTPAAIDAHVTAVAALLPFAVELTADMGANFSGHDSLVIDLGSRGGDDDPHDRAGIDEDAEHPTWWIETAGGETFEDSGITIHSDPVKVAQWLTDRAHALGCPAAPGDRPDAGYLARWEDAHRAADAWPLRGLAWDAFHTDGERCTHADTDHCPRTHDYRRKDNQ